MAVNVSPLAQQLRSLIPTRRQVIGSNREKEEILTKICIHPWSPFHCRSGLPVSTVRSAKESPRQVRIQCDSMPWIPPSRGDFNPFHVGDCRKVCTKDLVRAEHQHAIHHRLRRYVQIEIPPASALLHSFLVCSVCGCFLPAGVTFFY